MIVRGIARTPAGVLGDAVVKARLVSSDASTPGFLNGGGVIVDEKVVRGNSVGAFELDLTPNASITPAGTYYRVTIKAPYQRAVEFDVEIQVPATGGPYDIEDILVEAPEAPPPAYLTGAQLAAHKATVGDHDDVDLTGNSTGKVLMWNGTNFVPVDTVATDLEAAALVLVETNARIADVNAEEAARTAADDVLAATVATKETPAGAQAKADAAEVQAVGTAQGYTDSQVTKVVIDLLGIDAATLDGLTVAQLTTAITAAIVDASPATLDTLNELAAALGDDPNFAATLTALVGAETAAREAHGADTANPHAVTKAQVGLGAADNTSDTNKPISTATQDALGTKQALSEKDQAGGYAAYDKTLNKFAGLLEVANSRVRVVQQESEKTAVALEVRRANDAAPGSGALLQGMNAAGDDEFWRFANTGSFIMVDGPGNNLINLFRSDTETYIDITRDTETKDILYAKKLADANNRFILAASGKMSWGPGSSGADLTLERSAAGLLKTGITHDFESRDVRATRTMAIGGATPGTIPLNIIGTNGEVRLATVATDATNKTGRIHVAHYTNSEEPVAIMLLTSTSTASVLALGGSSGLSNAATGIDFYTAANNTTVTGTKRMGIDSSGRLGYGLVPAGSIMFAIQSNTTTYMTLQLKKMAAQTADILGITDEASVSYSRFNKDGVFMTRKNAAPADADLANSEGSIWWDPTPITGGFRYKGKDAAGLILSGSL